MSIVGKCLPSSCNFFYVKSLLRSVRYKVWEHRLLLLYVTCKDENAAVR